MKWDCAVCRGLSSMWDTLWSVTVLCVLYAGDCPACGIHCEVWLLYAGDCPTCGIRYEVGLCCVQGTVQHVGYIMKCECAVCRGLSTMWDTLWSVMCCVQGTVRHVGYIMKCDCIVCRGLLCLTCCPWWSRPTTCVPPEQSSWTTAAVSLSSPLHLRLYLISTFGITSPCLSLYLTSLFTLHYVLHLYLDLTSPLSWPHYTFIVHFPLFHLSVDLTSTLSWPHTTFILISLYLLPGLTSRFILHHFTFHFASFFVPWSMMIVQFVEHQTQKPGALLTWVRFPGVTRDFSSSQLPVQTLLQCLYCPLPPPSPPPPPCSIACITSVHI